MDMHRIDSHKLIFHPERVSAWQSGDNIFPIYMEISPSGACNHRCTFCGLDFMNYKPRFLKSAILRERLSELGRLGLKSVMFAGEGEPFLHRDMTEVAKHTKKSGIDVAFTTNGVLLKPEIATQILPVTSWIKVSCNAGNAETYAKLHRTKEKDYKQVFENLKTAVDIRQQASLNCALGLQSLLLPENQDEMIDLTQRCRDTGLDYLVIKPYSQHPQSNSKIYQDISYESCAQLADQLQKFNTDNFSVIFRFETMKRWESKEKGYDKCLALPFWSYIDASGNVWGCSVFLNDERFLYGNIYEQNFQDIWDGDKRKNSLDWCRQHLDTASCRTNCRMDKINSYLWELANPSQHINFI